MSLSYDFHSSTHANNGNVFQIVNNRDNNRTQNFIYDPLNRIQQAYTSGPSWGETFSPTPTAPGVAPTTSGIDAWGNLNNRSGVTGKTNYEPLSCTVNTNNQLTACSFNYDAAGNMTSNGSASYIYDAENRLIATAGMSYIYDGDGARVKKCTQGTTPGTCATGATGTLYWIRAGSDDPLVETDLAENRLEDYIFFNGQRIARREPGPPAVFHFYFSDHLGTHSLITDANGTMPPQSESDYYPYGGEIPISGSDSNHYKFNGKERDPESGLDNFGARYDSSALGRFMTPDWGGGPVPYASMGSPQTLNLYSYVMNNPVSKTDPTGHVCEGGDCGDSHGEGTSLAQEFSESVSRAVWGPSIGELMQNAAAASLAAQGELLDSLFESEAEQTTASNPSVQVNREAQNQSSGQPAPTNPDGTPKPPTNDVPKLPDGKPPGWKPGDPLVPNEWVPGTGTTDRPTRWDPKYPIPGQSPPNVSWDPSGHWDHNDGKGDRTRWLPGGGGQVDHWGVPIPSAKQVVIGIGAVGTGYLIYRGVRMLPSLVIPPLWPTIPLNAAIP